MNRCSQKRVQNKGVFLEEPNRETKFFEAFFLRCSLGTDLMMLVADVKMCYEVIPPRRCDNYERASV